jgi:hypothetical protein
MLLLCFVAGQYIVYSHNHADNTVLHKTAVYHHSTTRSQQILSENCQLCDAMHHNTMAVNSYAYFAPVVITGYFYKPVSHNFISKALIRSAGRSPPIS